MIFVITTPESTSTSSFDSWKKKFFFSWYPWGTPGTKFVNVVFSWIKLKNMIKNNPLFEYNRNKSILKGAEKWPYPPYSLMKNLFYQINDPFNVALTISDRIYDSQAFKLRSRFPRVQFEFIHKYYLNHLFCQKHFARYSTLIIPFVIFVWIQTMLISDG
jgi:hypothetical protein